MESTGSYLGIKCYNVNVKSRVVAAGEHSMAVQCYITATPCLCQLGTLAYKLQH